GGVQCQGRANGFPGQCHLARVRPVDELANDTSERRLVVARAAIDVGPADARKVDRVDGESTLKPWDHEPEVVELCPDRRGTRGRSRCCSVIRICREGAEGVASSRSKDTTSSISRASKAVT